MLGPSLLRFTAAVADRVVDGWWTTVASGTGSVIPDGAVDLMWTSGRDPWIAGPDTAPRRVELAAGSTLVAVRLKPGVAQHLLHDSVASAANIAVSMADVWRRTEVDDLVSALESASTMALRANALADAVAATTPADWSPDPLVVASIEQLRRSNQLSVDASERQLRRRFTQAMGYGTAFYRRVARLERFTDLCATTPSYSTADLAVAAGYFDEAHLWRDATKLAGRKPNEMRSEYH